MTNLPFHSMRRRSWLIGCIASGVAGATCNAWNWSQASSPDSECFHIKAVVKTTGEVRLKSQVVEAAGRSGAAKTAKTAPIAATTNLEFEESVSLSDEVLGSQSYVHVLVGNSEVQVDRHITKTTLRESCAEIVRTSTEEGLVTACLDNPLFAAERDLIDIPINSMFLDRLTSTQKIKVTDKWEIDQSITCRLLGLDSVVDGRLIACLVDVHDDVAQLEINGTVSGSVRKVGTSMTLDAKVQVDRSNNRVTWFAANLEETREISEHEPGFKILAQVQLKRTPIEAIATGETVSSIANRIPDRSSAQLQQFHSSLGYYRFLANRKWITYRDNGEEAIYRFIVDNRRIAQCNVTNLVDFEAGRQLTMEGFVADVKASLGKNGIEILESSERVTSSKMRSLKVITRGSVQDIEVVWMHYHISNDDGRRAAIVFMMNAEQFEEFGAEDAQIVDTFELINWPQKMDAKSIEQAAIDRKTGTEDGSKKPEAKTSDATNRFKTSK